MHLLGEPFWTFYQVGSFGTQNTNTKTRNNQLEPPPPYPQRAASPSTSMLGVGQRCHQIMVPPPPIGLRKALVIRLGGAAVGSLIWGANASPIKIERKAGLGRRWLPLSGKK
jgi:hypothetical protein